MEEHRFAELMAAALQGCRIPYTGRVWLGEEPKTSNSNGLHDGGSVQWADQQLIASTKPNPQAQQDGTGT